MTQRSIGPGAFAALVGAMLWIGSGSVLGAQDGPGPRPAEPYLQNERAEKPVPQGMPAGLGEGHRLYVAKCAACHSLGRSMQKSDLSQQEWADIVDRMRNRAASHMNDVQAKAILDYLVWDGQQRQRRKSRSEVWMPLMKTRFIAIAAVVLSLGGTAWSAAAEESARTISLIADHQFRLAGGQKGPLVLKAGEKVTFRVTASSMGPKAKDGAIHSFVVRKLRAQGWDVRLKEGVQEFTLTAPPPGEYLIECTVYCGATHDAMNLKMVVQ